MKWLHGGYAQAFNERHGTEGHVFQGRYGAKRMLSDPQLLMAIRYVVRNPVEARLCYRPAQWRWSSHAMLEAGSTPIWLLHTRLLELLAGNGDDPRHRYADLVDVVPKGV